MEARTLTRWHDAARAGARPAASSQGTRESTGPLLARIATAAAVVLACHGCVQDIDLPDVGPCADYPDGVYDYGDIGIGRCLASPTDLVFYETQDATVLYVVNSNAYLNFSTGSLLPIPWDSLGARLDDIRAAAASFPSDEEAPPATLFISDIVDSSTGVYHLPNFSGKMIIDGERQMAFVSNRLSMTTNLAADDPVYGIDLIDPMDPSPYDLEAGRGEEGGEAAVPDGHDEIWVQHDPYGMALAPRDRCNGMLYVVNETTHNVSVVDTNRFPIDVLNGDMVGLVTSAEFHDHGADSFLEMTDLAVTAGVPEDRWTVSLSEGTYRAWYRGEGLGDGGSVGMADSGDGLEFVPNATSPVLSPGTSSLSWDMDGIGRVTMVRYGSSGEGYLFLYEGRRWDESIDRYRKRIGMALSSTSLATIVEKYDVGDDGDPANDFVLEPGRAFDSTGTGSPWAFGMGSALVMWYTGEDDDGIRSLARAISYDEGVTWEEIAQITFETTGGDPAPADVVGTEQLDATGFFDTTLERYRLWFVAEDGDASWLAYAESEDGVVFVPGNLEGTAGGRLALPGDTVVRSPSIDKDGRILRLWYVSAASDDSSDWTLHYARGFDGVIWYPVDLPTALGGGQPWEGGPPAPTILKLTPGDGMRLEGESFGLAAVQLSTQSTALLLSTGASATDFSLQFTVLLGHVLGVGPSGSYRSDTAAFDDPAWDAYRVGEPAIDWANQQLYYAGRAANASARIGVATPRDAAGLAWTNAETSLPIEPASSGDVGDPEFVQYQGTDYLYYTERPGDGPATIRMVRRTAGDEAWEQPAEWSFPAPDDGSGVSAPSVLPPGGGETSWHSWFTIEREDAHEIGHAVSLDGYSWILDAEPALGPGSGGDWDDDHVEAPSVMRLADDSFLMWYAGYNGTHYRIGLAVSRPDASQGEGERQWNWTRYTETGMLDDGLVLQGETGWWDASGVTNPDVVFDEATGRYIMWYEGILGSLHRLGRAESRDGVHWTKVFAPPTSEDSFTFETQVVLSSEQGVEAPSSVEDGAISLEIPLLGGLSFSGVGATEISLSPDCSIAVVGARYVPAVYVLDVRDDSNEVMFDANYNGIEAMVLIENNAYDGTSSKRVGARSSLFSPSGDRLYMTTADPDAVLVFDPSAIPDASAARVLREGVLLGEIPLERGSVEDKGASSAGDVGPIGLAMSSDGRYLWVANANANNVYTIDLALGTVGEVVQVARDVGEMPVAIALSPDERYLVVANYLGEVEERGDREKAVHSTLAVVDADPLSPTFGQLLARVKNRAIED